MKIQFICITIKDLNYLIVNDLVYFHRYNKYSDKKQHSGGKAICFFIPGHSLELWQLVPYIHRKE